MDTGIRGRCAIVLGAGGGIGGGIARALAKEGVQVIGADRDLERAESLAHECRAAGLDVTALQADLGDRGSERALVEKSQERYGDIDILVNNTGGPPSTGVLGVAPSEWRMHFDAMILSVINLTDLVLQSMAQNGWGRIITSTSSGVVAPITGLGISNTLRSSLVGWSKTLAGEVASKGITSNIVLPGRIASDRAREMDAIRAHAAGKDPDVMSAELAGRIPAGRYGTADEYGDAVAFLASERAAYVNGSVIRIDGGMISAV